MNTIMNVTPMGIRVTDDDEILTSTIKSLVRNNTFCPNIKRTIFNLGKTVVKDKDGNDVTKNILATTIFFADGTKTTVKNSIHDDVDVVTKKVKLSNGTEIDVETASKESCEVGLVYALVKRMIGVSDDNGMVSGGFGGFLSKVVKNAWNQNIEDAKTKAEKSLKKSNKDEKKEVKKDSEQPSLRKCVQDLSALIGDLASKLSK